MKKRGQWQGMWTVVQLNWPHYLIATLVCLGVFVGMVCFGNPLFRLGCMVVWLGLVYFVVVSLIVSHWVYDSSDLYKWGWLDHVWKGGSPPRAVICHSGFDEVSEPLRELWPQTSWQILDHFDAAIMPEPSIARARRWYPPSKETISAPFHRWPISEKSADLVFGLLAIHELRSESERTAWFAEAYRCLEVGGRVVLVEHLRDLANFLVFGPHYVHFHSETSWRTCWEAVGFRVIEDFPITPFVRVFVLEK